MLENENSRHLVCMFKFNLANRLPTIICTECPAIEEKEADKTMEGSKPGQHAKLSIDPAWLRQIIPLFRR